MTTYIILSRFSPDAIREPQQIKELADKVSARIKSDCPGVRWKDSYATLGRFDVIDVVEAGDPKEIERVAMIIRAMGHASTETLVGTPWKEFLAAM
ncbi:MAG: GYD domain-containing protein [Gemmatimonadetes bacterium]|nr:GYD domain-containing protein [Gemmatimonadota bacterium]